MVNVNNAVSNVIHVNLTNIDVQVVSIIHSYIIINVWDNVQMNTMVILILINVCNVRHLVKLVSQVHHV